MSAREILDLVKWLRKIQGSIFAKYRDACGMRHFHGKIEGVTPKGFRYNFSCFQLNDYTTIYFNRTAFPCVVAESKDLTSQRTSTFMIKENEVGGVVSTFPAGSGLEGHVYNKLMGLKNKIDSYGQEVMKRRKERYMKGNWARNYLSADLEPSKNESQIFESFAIRSSSDVVEKVVDNLSDERKIHGTALHIYYILDRIASNYESETISLRLSKDVENKLGPRIVISEDDILSYLCDIPSLEEGKRHSGVGFIFNKSEWKKFKEENHLDEMFPQVAKDFEDSSHMILGKLLQSNSKKNSTQSKVNNP